MPISAAQPAELQRARAPRSARTVKALAVLAMAGFVAAPLAIIAFDAANHEAAQLAPISVEAQPQRLAVASEIERAETDRRANMKLTATSAAEVEEHRAAQRAEEERLAQEAEAERLAEEAAEQQAVSGQVAASDSGTRVAVAEEPASYSYSSGNSSIADLAAQYTGVPYVFGGADPSGWDCSGFVKWVVQQTHGITLPHGATDQAYNMTWIPASEAQPGDFWFRGSPGGYYHVAIYLGDGMIVHAVDYGILSRIEPIYASGDFYRL